jgi:hypothetical protein
MLNKLKGFLIGLGVAVAFTAAATATYVSGTSYVGFNPLTGVNGEPGVNVGVGGTSYATTSNTSGPAVPGLVVTGTSCAASTPAIKGTLGKASITTGTGTATCTYTVSNLPTVSVGYKCSGLDVTTPADALVQSVSGVNGCTLTQSTKASADVVIIDVSGL